MKKYLALLLINALIITACNSTRTVMMQNFEPVPVDMTKIDQKDYSELINMVDKIYGSGKDIFKYATLLKEESIYIYVRVYSSVDESCYRVSVDRNRSKAVNVQPDCSVSIEN